MSRIVGLLGSGEFLPWAAELDRFLLDSAAGGDGSVVILPTASAPEGDEVFERWASMGLAHYESQGVQARVVPIKTREDANHRDCVDALRGASMVFFSGGNPAYVSDTMRDTDAWRLIVDMLDRGAALAGCSAGACMMGEQAPDPTRIARIEEAFRPRGLGLLPGVVIGAHWDMLDSYFPGLRAMALRSLPEGCRMIGIDEDTAMASEGASWRVLGKGLVHVYDGDDAITYAAGQSFTL